MPKFKKNPSPAMYKKPSSFKMKGFSGFGNSPVHQNWLDTKLKDVKKNISTKIKKVKENIGNTTVRDVLNLSPTYKQFTKVIKKINKPKNDVSDAAKNALRSLTAQGLMGKLTRKTINPVVMPKIDIKAIKKLPVDNTVRLFTTPKKYNIPKKRRS